VRVGWSREDSQLQWCRFNASILARDGRRRDKTLPKNKVEAASSSWLNGTQHGGMMTSAGGEAAPRREKGGDDITWVYTNLTRPKNEKKIHTVDSVSINGR
jgi:hypothetical protein